MTPQQRAYKRFHTALRDGRIVKPSACSQCSKIPPPSLLHGHHHRGYGRWWDVVWLCLQCHRGHDLDKCPRGKRNGMAKHPERSFFSQHNPNKKLSAEQVSEIRTLKASGITGRTIAAQFSITERTVYHVLSGHTWKSPLTDADRC